MAKKINSTMINKLQERVDKARGNSRVMVENARSSLSRLGMDTSSTIGSREYDNVLGYCTTDQTYSTYKKMYDRGDIAKRIVDAPVSAVWANPPSIIEVDDKAEFNTVSKLNREWNRVYNQLNIGETYRRADRMSRLGSYSVIYVGYDDGIALDRKPRKGSKIAYLQPLSYDNVNSYDLVEDITNPRNGLPEYYYITNNQTSSNTTPSITTVESGKSQISTKVHHSRIIHVTDDNLDSNIESVPIFTHVYNRLVDLIKIVGGSAEMFWLGARPGYAAIADPDTNVTEENYEQMEQMLEAYDNDLTRWIQTSGIKIESLSPQVYSPKDHFDVSMACISAATGIPQRILTGAEAGELASTQDKANWETTVVERRSIFAEPKLLRPLISKLQEAGQLSLGDYSIVWPDLTTMSEQDKADAAYKNSQAFMYATMDVNKLKLIGAKVFCTKIMNWDDETTKEVSENWDATIKEIEAKQQTEDAKDNQFVDTAINSRLTGIFGKLLGKSGS